MKIVDDRQSGSRIELACGNVVLVRLKENPTTGYCWSLEDAGGLMLEASAPVAGGGAVGAAGVHEFRLRAMQPGLGHVQLKHWRAWQGDSSVIGRFDITVQIT